jgi:rubrerythrin
MELSNMEATLKELEILPGDKLEIEVYDDEIEDFEDTSAIKEVEKGFVGTMLENTFEKPTAAAEWNCPQCTFLNIGGSCDACAYEM